MEDDNSPMGDEDQQLGNGHIKALVDAEEEDMVISDEEEEVSTSKHPPVESPEIEKRDLLPPSTNIAQIISEDENIRGGEDPEMPMKIKTDYIRSTERANASKRVCPRCNNEIVESEYEEHMKMEFLDPRWKEERKELEKQMAGAANTANFHDTTHYLKDFARERPDIFGSQTDHLPSRYGMNENLMKPKITPIYDGQHEVLTRTTQNAPMQAQQTKKYLEQHIQTMLHVNPKDPQISAYTQRLVSVNPSSFMNVTKVPPQNPPTTMLRNIYIYIYIL